MGGIFPAGLPIGEVVDVEPDEFGLNQTAYVKPGANLYDIKNVIVVKRGMIKPDAGGNAEGGGGIVKKLLLPLLFLFLFVFESIFIEFLPLKMFGNEVIFVPRLLLIAILFFTIFGDVKQGILTGFIMGLLFDVVYTGILGIYLVLFPLIAFLVSKIMKALQANAVILTFVSLVAITLLEFAVYEMNYLIKITNMEFSAFLEKRLLPTLILNLLVTIIIGYPLKRFFEKYKKEIIKE